MSIKKQMRMMNKYRMVSSMVTILDAGTGPGALAGLKRLVLDFQLGPWVPPLWNNLSSKPQLHVPKGRGSTHRDLLATVRSQTPGWWRAGLPAIAQIFINVTCMLKAGLLVCYHTFFLTCLFRLPKWKYLFPILRKISGTPHSFSDHS